MGQEAKSLLFIDNCSAHPPENVLTSEDEKIKAKFLPPNVTSLIQPMDQGVIEYIKRRYRKGLLRSLLFSTENADTITFLKSINILHVQWNLYKWGLYKWGTSISGGILDFLYSFPYKWTSINGEVGNGGPRVFRSYLLHTK